MYFLVQTLLLVLKFTLVKTLPWVVVLFPTLLVAGIVVLFLIAAVFAAVVK